MDESDFPEPVERYETKDGSITLYDPARDVHYRSIHGARRESEHVFLGATRITDRGGTWHILELGFGAAVNFTGAVSAFTDSDAERLIYHAVDYRPVGPSDIDFHEGMGAELARTALERHHDGQDETTSVEDASVGVALTLHALPWRELDLRDFRADALFYDPFGPRDEPESWTPDCFEVAREHLADDGVLATYSAATRVKEAMVAAGLEIATYPGPGRKREITLAALAPEALTHAKRLSAEKYST